MIGDGQDAAQWQSDPLPLSPGGLYELRFRARLREGTGGGAVVAGTTRLNRDFRATREWQPFAWVFRQPEGETNAIVRLGQWHVQGTIEFDEVSLLPVRAIHESLEAGAEVPGETFLGEAESLRGGWYRFRPRFGWEAGNFHRPLVRATAGFNTDRWVFHAGEEVVYRFDLPGAEQQAATLDLALNYHMAGRLRVEAAVEPESWSPLATLDGSKRGCRINLPSDLFPAKAVWIRLRCPDAETNLQLNRFDYQAHLADACCADAHGATRLIVLARTAKELELKSMDLRRPPGSARVAVDLEWTNRTDRTLRLAVTISCANQQSAARKTSRLELPPHGTGGCRLDLAATQPGAFPVEVCVAEDGRAELLALRSKFQVPLLDDPRPGHRLAGAPELDLWWCESGWKISREREPPPAAGPVEPLTVRLARGEFEAAQLVIRPRSRAELVAVEHTAFSRGGSTPGEVNLELLEVAYVPVTTPTDSTCAPGWYPDPLPPLELPMRLRAGKNHPLWLSFYVPRHVRAGTVESRLSLVFRSEAGESRVTVPLRVQIYDFELPRVSHLRSAFGLGTGDIQRYHKLTRREDQIAVFGKYLNNFAEHRISPYSFFDYAPIRVWFEGEGADKRARVDFSEFDRWAERWLDGPKQPSGRALAGDRQPEGDAPALPQPSSRAVPFNSFRLPLHGMGGGTFHSRHLGRLEGFEEGTPEHARLFRDYLSQVEAHLRQKGWLRKAYTYWFDEPDPKDYAFVIAGQERIKAAAPGLKRMLTEQPEPALLGHVDIWCGLTPHWTPEAVQQRHRAGEEVWWYICTAPKAPYLTEFIDHAGTELRLWPWQSWQYGVDGILVWATTYWTSPLAYPDSLQDPWEDPMSWVSGYGRPVETRQPWGNGDGRFLYPPRRNPNTSTAPCLDGPINSLRWENLRDGMEDYEYLWLLQAEIRRCEAGPTPAPARLLEEARTLLAVPPELSRDLTHFTTDPRVILVHRHRVARMIEQLRRLH